MNKPNPAKLFGFLVLLLAFMGGLALLKGGVFVAKHEGDTLHLMQIILRMGAGQWPHVDFMTPIGALAFAPIAFFVDLGAGIGHAILYAQIAVGAVLLPAAWWVGVSRLQSGLAYLFGAIVIVLVTALVFGLSDPSISISMHYNRWAWAISFIAIALAVLPTISSARPAIDGGIIGVCMAALVLLKMTYFVAFAPAIIIGLLLQKSYRTLGLAMIAGIAALGVFTLFSGPGFWLAYLGDLLQVAQSSVRPQPGHGLITLILAPPYLGGTIVAGLGFLLLRQSDDKRGGAALAVLVPGFYYVTFQNFGNDPQWLMLLGILLFALRPEGGQKNRWGWDLRAALNVMAIGALALAAPVFINLASSPYRHLALVANWYEPILPRSRIHDDLQAIQLRNQRVDARVAMDGAGSGLEHLAEAAEREGVGTILGEPMATCEVLLGLTGWLDTIVQDLEQAGLAKGKRMFVADIFSSHWMFGDFEPLLNGAPWYYGGLPGIESADYLLVPLCPSELKVRTKILDALLLRKDITLTEIRRTPLYILLDVDWSRNSKTN